MYPPVYISVCMCVKYCTYVLCMAANLLVFCNVLCVDAFILITSCPHQDEDKLATALHKQCTYGLLAVCVVCVCVCVCPF